MASLANTMAGTAVGLGSVALMGRAAGMAQDSFGNGRGRGKKKKKRRGYNNSMVGGFVDLTVGTALLGGAAGMANAIP
jgi:hypothetical protein